MLDGKPGHDNQTLALASSIAQLTGLSIHKVAADQSVQNPAKPVLAIGAGHSTHIGLLKLQWLYGAKSIVLMRPSLPGFLFSLSIIPMHDRPLRTGTVLTSQGVLTSIKPANKNINTGTILIGGSTKSCPWEDIQLYEELDTLINTSPSDINWSMFTSRRTPKPTLSYLKSAYPELAIFSSSEKSSQQLYSQLSCSEFSWVTSDSVNMVYESLTAECKTGILLDQYHRGKISKQWDKLLHSNKLINIQQLLNGATSQSSHNFNESQKIASRIVKSFIQ